MPDDCPSSYAVTSPSVARSPGGRRTGGASEYLRAIGDVAQATVDREHASDVFRRIVGDARTLVGAASSTIGILEPGGTSLRIGAASGARAELLPVGGTLPLAGTLSSWVVRTRRPLVVPGPEHAAEPHRSVLVRFGLGPAMCMPLVAGGRVFGTMSVAHARGDPPFRPADVALVEAFAHQAAIALEFARVREELRRLLGPGILADRQLERALRDLASDFAQRTGIIPSVDIDPEVAARLGGAAASEVVQLAREALSNVARHAQAAACHLELRRQANVAVLEVADDGRGISGAEVRGTGQGLSNIQARADALGGVLRLERGLAGRGVALRVLVPV